MTPFHLSRWIASLTIALALQPLGPGAVLHAQAPTESSVPAVFRALEGSWTGTGELMGRPAEFRMSWDAESPDSIRLSFTNAWVGEGGATTTVLSAEATYSVTSTGMVGVWTDTRPQRLMLRATLTDSTVVTDWTAEAEQGRTEYIVRSATRVFVRDHVLVDGEYRPFAEAAYRREESPPPSNRPGQPSPPVIDMHLHALGANDQGPPPLAMCTPIPGFPAWDNSAPYGRQFMQFTKEPTCDDPVWSPTTDAALRDETLAVVERLNVYGVLSGPTHRVLEWQRAAPGRFLAGLGFNVAAGPPSPDSLRKLVETGALEVLAEVTNQYSGVAPDAEAMAAYWALAEELDLPVGIHMGPGPPGGIYLGQTRYRAALSSALLLEEVLVRHPRLRVYVMHAGYPLLDDMLALLYAHPQVHVEVGVVVYSRPRADFYRYLRALVDAGFEDRIMFGSDQMVWPGTIERGIAVIEEAPFLTHDQKRAILYDNAARFLRLAPETMERHRGG